MPHFVPARQPSSPVRRCLTRSAALLLLLSAFPALARAAAGDVDTSFAGDGSAVTAFGNGPSIANDVARQSDGKLVVAGLGTGRGGEIAVARFNENGSPDPSFGAGGQVTTYLRRGQASAVAVQSDGKILVGGTGGPFSGRFVLLRYQPNGSLDTAFGDAGKVALDSSIAGNGFGVEDLALHDGKIIVGGGVGGAGSDFVLARFNGDGSLDTSFSGDGWLRSNIGDSSDDLAGLAVQSDGKVVVGGTIDDMAAVVRYKPDGSLDTAFSDDGWSVGPGRAGLSVTLAPDGKIAMTARRTFGSTSDVYRFTAGGDLDSTFSGDGVEPLPDASMAANAVAALGDGRLVVGGTNELSGGNDFSVVRFNATGTVDSGYITSTNFGTFGYGLLKSLLLDPDGRAVAVGAGGDWDDSDFAITRYGVDGGADPSFDTDGRQTMTFAGFDAANAMAVQPSDGKIVVAGVAGQGADNTQAWGGGDFAIARFNTNGTPDTSFDSDGRLTTDFGGFYDAAYGIAIQSDGKIIAAGGGGTGEWTLARYTTSGQPDSSFDGDGRVQTALPLYSSSHANAVALQSTGKIVVAGSSGGKFTVARYTSAGQLDNTFDGDGMLQLFPSDTFASAEKVVVMPNDKIVVAGGSGTGGWYVARLNSDGTPDSAFGTSGTVSKTSFPSFRAQALAVQSDGKVLIGGVDGGSGYQFAVTRLRADGTADSGFSGDGTQNVSFGTAADRLTSLALRNDGSILLAGAVTTSFDTGDTDAAFARLNSTGAIDTSFSGDGKTLLDFNRLPDAINAAAIDGAGNIIGAGYASDSSTDLAVVRLQGGGPVAGDTTPPTIWVLTSIEDQHFDQHETVNVLASCFDESGGSGVASCDGPATLDTSTPGPHSVTLTASDNAGNTTSLTLNYIVDAVGGSPGDGDGAGAGSGDGSGDADNGSTDSSPTASSGSAGTGSTAGPPPAGSAGSATPPPSPSTGGSHGAAEITIRGPSKLTPSSRGVVGVKLTCTSATQCRGTVVLASVTGGGARAAKVLRLARASYRISAGKTAAVKVKLTPKARKLLRKARGGRMSARLAVTPAGASSPVLTKSITLHRKR